jgi:hypothetical protein
MAPPSFGGPAIGLRLLSTQDVADLVADLKDAAGYSRRTGGSQVVFRLDERRRPLLLVEIHLPFNERSAPGGGTAPPRVSARPGPAARPSPRRRRPGPE